jgi:hypothetical protein
MATSRTRSWLSATPGSGKYYHKILGTWTTGTYKSRIATTCTDVVGNRKGVNSFSLEREGSREITMNGNYNGYIYEGYPTAAGSYNGPSHLLAAVPDSTQLNQYAVATVAKSNPNAPHVSIPTFVAELRELPSLIRSFGLKHLRYESQYRNGEAFTSRVGSMLADRHLQYRWGIAPMISDIRRLVSFSEATQRALRGLERLASGRVLKRKVQLDSGTAQSLESNVPIWSIGAGAGVKNRRRLTTRKTWGSCQWRLVGPVPNALITHDARLATAKRLVGGLNPANLTATAWEILPWSWFIDWFTGFGNLFTATNNTVPVEHFNHCVMRTTSTVETGEVSASPGITLSGTWYRFRESKIRRTVTTPNPVTISFEPILSADKWSILSSLAISKRGLR